MTKALELARRAWRADGQRQRRRAGRRGRRRGALEHGQQRLAAEHALAALGQPVVVAIVIVVVVVVVVVDKCSLIRVVEVVIVWLSLELVIVSDLCHGQRRRRAGCRVHVITTAQAQCTRSHGGEQGLRGRRGGCHAAVNVLVGMLLLLLLVEVLVVRVLAALGHARVGIR